jgi:catechol 2,3-dioxygenase-like lactoylglutathione lyase family enzyme
MIGSGMPRDPATPVIGLSHVAIGVRDLDEALTFYRDVIGLTVRFDEVENWASLSVAPQSVRRAAYLEYCDYRGNPTATFLVLDQQLGREPFGEPSEFYQVGIHHFGFWVSDVDKVAERARAAGMPPFYGPTTADDKGYGEAPGRQHRTALFRDPEGNIVQCDQRLGIGDTK